MVFGRSRCSIKGTPRLHEVVRLQSSSEAAVVEGELRVLSFGKVEFMIIALLKTPRLHCEGYAEFIRQPIAVVTTSDSPQGSWSANWRPLREYLEQSLL